MTVSTFDNGPVLDGFVAPPGKHCGLICVDLACPVCGSWVNAPETHLQRGEN